MRLFGWLDGVACSLFIVPRYAACLESFDVGDEDRAGRIRDEIMDSVRGYEESSGRKYRSCLLPDDFRDVLERI